MDIHSREKPIKNPLRLTTKGFSLLAPMVDQMLKSELYESVPVRDVIAHSFTGDFPGLLTQLGATRDFLEFHRYANKDIDTSVFGGWLVDGTIIMLDETILDKIRVRF